MQTKQETYVDKSTWGEGPWAQEPDKLQWQDEATGLPCLIVRGPVGALCGYVGVSQGHKHYAADYNDVDVGVHGGLTYASGCAGKICHEVDEGEDDNVHWFGFDCAHSGDLSPTIERYNYRSFGGYSMTYRDLTYVKQEVASLARQLKALE